MNRFNNSFRWNVSTLQAAVDNCTNLSGVIEECPYFDFITDTAAQACVIPPSINEQVFGVMPNLPGCNVVQNGPAKSEAQSKCEAPTQIGPLQLPYVDLTGSEGFAYVGCGSDPGGQTRTLLGGQVNNATGMTVEYCVDYCVSRGFSVAGKHVTNLHLDNVESILQLGTLTNFDQVLNSQLSASATIRSLPIEHQFHPL